MEPAARLTTYPPPPTLPGQGIWWACYSFNYTNANCGANGSPSYYVWYQTLNFTVGAYHMPIMKRVFTSLPWWTLAPDGSAVAWSKTAPSGQDTQKPYQKASTDRTTVLAYLPRSDCGTYNGTFTGLSSSIWYRIRWVSPRNGSETVIYSRVKGPAVPIPPAPSQDDWVLIADAAPESAAAAKEIRPAPDALREPRAEFQASVKERQEAGSLTSFVTKVASLGTERSGASTGMNITVGPAPVTVAALGWCVPPPRGCRLIACPLLPLPQCCLSPVTLSNHAQVQGPGVARLSPAAAAG